MNTKLSLLAATALSLFVTDSTVQAAPEGGEGTFMIRARAIGILADGDGTVTGTALDTDVDNAYTPEVDFTYFFTDHIAAELIAATAEHTVDAGPNELGDTWILPPTLTVQYHFQPREQFSPYIGAGLNYSFFYSEDASGAFSDLEVDNGLGYAVQAGFDYWVDQDWGFNFDVKYVDLDVDVSVNSGGATLRADDVDIDPVIVGAGLVHRF